MLEYYLEKFDVHFQKCFSTLKFSSGFKICFANGIMPNGHKNQHFKMYDDSLNWHRLRLSYRVTTLP